MTTTEKLHQFVQSVYLMRYNRYVDDITDEDGVIEVNKTIDWTNQFLDEFEEEADWEYARENDKTIGTITTATQTFDLPVGALRLVVAEDRPLVIMQDGSIVNRWDVVDPNQPTKRNTYNNPAEQRVTFVNNKIVFSRPFNDTELGGIIVADVVNSLPRLSLTDVRILDLVKPKALLQLGVAKNATLPDIVQGGLSPSFAEKYADLLEKAVMRNDASSVADTAVVEDFSDIAGVY